MPVWLNRFTQYIINHKFAKKVAARQVATKTNAVVCCFRIATTSFCRVTNYRWAYRDSLRFVPGLKHRFFIPDVVSNSIVLNTYYGSGLTA